MSIHGNTPHGQCKPRGHGRRGISLLECTVASSIMAVLVVAGIRSAGAAGVVVFAASQRSTGMSLALSLLAEIERHPYEDPQGGATIGINGGENAGDKTTFDDIDDFHGWSESPPQSSGGVPMIEHTGWTRSVSVHFVDPANPTQTVASSRGLKRITVTVARGGKSVAMAWSLRSAAP
jgi:hypothetical protein